MRRLPILVMAALPMAVGAAPPSPPAEEWVAPAGARGLVNPVPGDADAVKRGRGLYAQHCAICHGPKGQGDGPSARLHAQRARRPKDLTVPEVQAKLTDGEIFWKITTGWRRGPQIVMPSFEADVPSADDRWKLVHFVRSLATTGP